MPKRIVMLNKTITILEAASAMMLSAMISFVMPIAGFLIFTIVLVVVDMYTGVRAAMHRGESISSKGLGRTVTKITLYMLAILLSKGFDDVFFVPKSIPFDVTWIVATMIGLTEFRSNMENISTVTGVPFWAAIASRVPKFFGFHKPEQDDQRKAPGPTKSE